MFVLNEKILRAGEGNILIVSNMFTIHYQHDKAHGWSQKQKIKDRRAASIEGRAIYQAGSAWLGAAWYQTKLARLGTKRVKKVSSAWLGNKLS